MMRVAYRLGVSGGEGECIELTAHASVGGYVAELPRRSRYIVITRDHVRCASSEYDARLSASRLTRRGVYACWARVELTR
jgi:hypothetical protein